MINLSRRHLCRPVLRGPAERVMIEIWLTTLAGLAVNAYPDVRDKPEPSWSLSPSCPHEEYATVEALPERRPAPVAEEGVRAA